MFRLDSNTHHAPRARDEAPQPGRLRQRREQPVLRGRHQKHRHAAHRHQLGLLLGLGSGSGFSIDVGVKFGVSVGQLHIRIVQ